MPKASIGSATEGGDHGIVVDRSEELGGYTVNFLTFREDMDHSPLLKGLPDDRCQSPHWGYVTKGKIVLRFADHDESYEMGDAFYAPPGHVPVHNEPGTEYVQFSPTEDVRKTTEAIMRNFQAMQAGQPA